MSIMTEDVEIFREKDKEREGEDGHVPDLINKPSFVRPRPHGLINPPTPSPSSPPSPPKSDPVGMSAQNI